MYTTKRLSELKAIRKAVSQPPPGGPYSGYIVLNDDDHEEDHVPVNCWCWGLAYTLEDLPFPQNAILTVEGYDDEGSSYHDVLFIPVVDFPLAANRYYVVVAAGGSDKGCFAKCVHNWKPFDHRDIYQQVEIIPHRGRFIAKSVAPNALPPSIFREKYCKVHKGRSINYQFAEALGVNETTRLNYLELNPSTSVIVGRWYCPFIFLRESGSNYERTVFYEVTLEQFWEKAHSGTITKKILLNGKEPMREERECDGFIWFIKIAKSGTAKRIRLSMALWEQIKWEESNIGWDESANAMVQEVNSECFVLVERFTFNRFDGSVALVLDFIHNDKVRAK